MSKSGIERLSARTRLNYIKEVYIPIGKRIIDTEVVYDESTLAKWLLMKEGEGFFTGHFWTQKPPHRLGKQAFKVMIRGNLETKMNYDFIHTRGIARYGFWIGEF